MPEHSHRDIQEDISAAIKTQKKQAGQDERAFAEAVKLATNESDIAALMLQDALCLVILTGCKNVHIRKSLKSLPLLR